MVIYWELNDPVIPDLFWYDVNIYNNNNEVVIVASPLLPWGIFLEKQEAQPQDKTCDRSNIFKTQNI